MPNNKKISNYTCIVCPKGCNLTVTFDESNITVSGNSCKRGESYGISEATNPVRMITSTIKVINGTSKVVSVALSKPIPKKMIFDVMKEINNKEVLTPIKLHDVLIHNVLNSGVDVIATKEVLVKEDDTIE